MKKELSQKKNLTVRLVITALLGAWFAVILVASLFPTVSLTDPAFVYDMDYLWFSVGWAVLFGLLLVYGSLSPAVVKWFALISSFAYCLRAAYGGRSFFLAFALCGIMAGMLLLCGVEIPTVKRALSRRTSIILLAVIGLVGGGVMIALSVGRYAAYLTSPSGSTGVYAQMLWHMTQGAGQTTTLEFGEAVSHFAAHISPIFYVYLPFYALLPSPVTLMVLQGVAVTSAVIPLYLIARRRGLSRGLSVGLCALLPTFSAVMWWSTNTIHEYALLLPLLLWLLWALEARRPVLTALFAILCLCVRETAALYVMTVGLYWLLSHGGKAETDPATRKRERTTAILLAVGAAVYLVAALVVLTYVGRGTLITRYENITGVYNTSFWTLVWEILMNPALILTEMLATAKLHFAVCLLLPLALLPLFSKKKAGLICLFPLILVNLLPDSSFQHDLTFPYGVGMTALLFYLSVQALSRWKETSAPRPALRRTVTLAVCFTLVLSAFLYGYTVGDEAGYMTGGTDVATLDDALALVPEDASVSASGRLIPHLTNREAIHRLNAEADTDYVVLDLREDWMVWGETSYDVDHYKALGYTVVSHQDGVVAVLARP